MSDNVFIDSKLNEVLLLSNQKPNFTISMYNHDKTIGTLDFNGPTMVFTGDAEESARVFFDWVATAFKQRLEDEYQRGFNAAADVK